MSLTVVRSIDAPRALATVQEAGDFEQEMVDQYLLAGVGAGLADSTVARDRVAVFDFIRFLGRPIWTAGPHDADRYLAHLRRDRKLAASTVGLQPPRRRNVPSVTGWAVEAVAGCAENVRPRFGCPDHPALRVTERGGRVKPAEVNARFTACRDALGLPSALVPHSLRHSRVTRLAGDGAGRRFIQEAAGHRCGTSTAIHTHVSGDFMNTALRKALAPALDGQPG
jgi:integrase